MQRHPIPSPGHFALLTLFVITSLSPGGAAAGPVPSSAPRDEGMAMFWEVTAPEPEGGTAWLLGSIHVGNEGLYPLPPTVEAAWQQSVALVVEVASPSSEAEQREISALLGARAFFTDERTLQGSISPQAWRQVLAALPGLGISPAMAQRYKPWFLGLVLVVSELERRGYVGELGIDFFMQQRAKARGLPVRSLETAAFQFGLFDSLPLAEQEELLLSGAFDPEALRSTYQQIFASWKAGDVAALERALFVQIKDQPHFENYHRRFFLDRNRGMVDRLREMMQRGQPLFVVVGSGHLVGEGSLPALFRDAGYGVRQLRREERP